MQPEDGDGMSNARDAASREKAFHEIGEGSTYKRTKKKHGTKVANSQRIAIYLSKSRRGEYEKRAQRKAGRK
jgi:hypothetical protein